MKILLIAAILMTIQSCTPNTPTNRLKIEKHPNPKFDTKIRYMKFFLI